MNSRFGNIKKAKTLLSTWFSSCSLGTSSVFLKKKKSTKPLIFDILHIQKEVR